MKSNCEIHINRGFLSNAMRLFTISSCPGNAGETTTRRGWGWWSSRSHRGGPQGLPQFQNPMPSHGFCWYGWCWCCCCCCCCCCSCCCCCCCWKKSESIKTNVCQSGKDEFMNAYVTIVTCFSSQTCARHSFWPWLASRWHHIIIHTDTVHHPTAMTAVSRVQQSPKALSP